MGVLEDAFAEGTKGLDLMEKRDRFIAAYFTRRAAKMHQQKPSADGSQLALQIVSEQEKIKPYISRKVTELVKGPDAKKPAHLDLTVMANVGVSSASAKILEQTYVTMKTIEFETWILDNQTGAARPSEAEKPQPQQQARFGAAGSGELRRSGRAKYCSTTIDKYQVTKEGRSIVSADDLTHQPVRKPASYSEALESLRQLQQQDSTKSAELKILRLSELKKVQQ